MSPPGAPTVPRTRPSPTDRDALLRLAQGAPWSFLAPALDHLLTTPDDHEVRLLAALHMTELRLRTPALEQIEALPEPIRATPEATQIEAAARRLPADEISVQARVATCRRNLDALGDRAGGLNRAFDGWAATHAASRRYFRAKDGNIVSRGPGAWSGFRDARAGANASHRHAGADAAETPPLVLDGLAAPWLLEKGLRDTPPSPNGYRAPVLVVEAELFAALDAFSILDLSASLADTRVRVFAGDGAVDGLREWLSARPDARLPGAPLRDAATAPDASPVRDAIAAATSAQERALRTLRDRVDRVYSARDRMWWAARFADRARTPLRVLIASSRYSSFVRHSAEDIARAVENAGHAARVLMEPDEHSLLTSLSYWRAIDEFEPDLVVVINYPRASLKGCFPENIPYACWVQDALSHLFSGEIGGAQTELDFLVGHLHPALFEKFEYPRSRGIRSPVLASAHKFHAQPVSHDARARFECEVAYVGHQSETPERFRERLLREAHAGPMRSAIDRVCAGAPSIVDDALELSPQGALDALTRSALRESLGRDPADADVALLHTRCTQPFADRVFRHQALAWAADIAERRGWRFRVYGRGWENHPRLRAHARPAIEHGEDLRACYQSAGAHLHVSINTLAHQRVFECALSGGLPLCRMHRDELSATETWCARECILRGECWLHWLPIGADLFPAAWNPWLMRLTFLRQRLGIEARPNLAIDGAYRARAMSDAVVPREMQADHFLTDIPSVTYWSSETLEEALDRAVRRPAWRDNASRSIGARVRADLTYESVLPKLFASIAEGLAGDKHAC